MKSAILKRKIKNQYGIFGQLDIDNYINRFITLEHDILYIPAGSYNVVRDTTGKYRWYEVQDVPNRTEIELHEGNLKKHTRGCILVGLYYLDYEIRKSKKALTIMKDYFKNEDWNLTIKEDFKTY